MRTLSATLLSAQKQPSTTPYVRVEARNKIAGVVRYDWTRLYTGSEPDYFHALTMPGDGSLIRARITPPADSRKLYRQRVPNPGPSSDFSSWVYTDQYNAIVVAAASLGAEVSIFWIKNDRSIYQLKSNDYGATWDSPALLGYTPTTAINGIAAAYKPNGDIALFYADQATLYVKKRTGGSWGSAAAWDKSTGDLSGVASVYSGDWNLLVSGKDSNNNFKLWSLVYGDGSDVAAGAWSSLKEIASAPSGGDFEYHRPFIDKPDVYRFFFIEKFTGSVAYYRPFWSHSVLDSKFIDNLCREPVPFNLSSEYGLGIAHFGGYCWLSNPTGVWRASLTAQSLDLSGDVTGVKQELDEKSGKLIAELKNDSGQYGAPGAGSLTLLNLGCQLDFSPGYRTSAGNEVSSGLTFSLEAYEHTSSGGKATFVLHAEDASKAVRTWRARHQFRWNKSPNELAVKDILAFVLARVGLKLEVKSESSIITGFYPDFTISPNDSGEAIIDRLLSFVPDVLLIEGVKAYVVNPQAADSSVYSYGTEHRIFEGRYREGTWELNRIQVEGYDASGETIIADSFAWEEIGRLHDRLRQLEDRNIDSVAKAQQRGQAHLRKAEIESAHSHILVPVNCGQQLYDVVDLTDSLAGLSAKKKRVLGLALEYNPSRSQYRQRLWLGAV